MSSSTRPSSCGSRSSKPRTPPRMCFQARAMSAWSRCGQPSCWQVPFFQSMLRGTSGQRLMPSRDGLTACQTSMNGWPTISTCLPTVGLRRCPGRSGSPWSPGTRWSTSTPTRRCGPGLKSRRCSARSSTPPRNSTTTPSIRRSSPQTFSTSSASWRPSTKIRLARATRAFTSWTATEPLAVRVVLAGPPAVVGRTSDDRLALEQEAGAEREGTPLARAGPRASPCRGRGRRRRSRRTSR